MCNLFQPQPPSNTRTFSVPIIHTHILKSFQKSLVSSVSSVTSLSQLITLFLLLSHHLLLLANSPNSSPSLSLCSFSLSAGSGSLIQQPVRRSSNRSLHMANRSRGLDIVESTAPASQFSVGTYFYDSKVGKGLLQVMAYIIPILWCANKITIDPLFLYFYSIDKENMCIVFSESIGIFTKYFDEWGIVINIMSLFSLVLRKCLFKKKFEKIAWLLLIAMDLWSHTATHLPINKFLLMVMSLVWPYANGSNYYSTSGFLLQYLAAVYLMHRSYERVARKSAILAKATWARVVFNLLLLCHVAHVFGGLWYAFAIAKNIDCWAYASKNYTSPYGWGNSYCGAVGRSSAAQTILKEICQPKSRNTTLFDFGIYYEAYELGIVEQPNYLLRILYCLYWGLQNLRGQFFQFAKDRWELVFLILMFVSGMLIFAYLTGNILIYLLFRNQELENARQQKRETEKSRLFAKFPKDVRKEIKRFQPKKWESDDDDHLRMIFLNLPDDIIKEIKGKFFLEIIKKVEEFRSWSDDLLDELCDKVTPVSYPRYTRTRTIQKQGSSIEQMLFIVCGKLETCSSDWSIDYLQDEMFCGEELIYWLQADPYSVNRPISTRTIKTMTKVDAFILEAGDLQQLFIKHRATFASTQEQAPPEPENFGGGDDDKIVEEGGSKGTIPEPSHHQQLQSDSCIIELLEHMQRVEAYQKIREPLDGGDDSDSNNDSKSSIRDGGIHHSLAHHDPTSQQGDGVGGEVQYFMCGDDQEGVTHEQLLPPKKRKKVLKEVMAEVAQFPSQNSTMSIIEALQLQMEVQKRLHEQLEWWLVELFPVLREKISKKNRNLESDLPRCMRRSLKRTPINIHNLDDFPPIVGIGQTLEPTDAKREMDYWKSFNPNHIVHDEVYKYDGGRSDDDDDDDDDDDHDDGVGDEAKIEDDDEVEGEDDDEVEGDDQPLKDIQSVQSESEDTLSEFQTKKTHDVQHIDYEVKRLFEFIVDLQETTHKKLSRMDKRQKATFQIVREMDRRLRRVEEHLHIPRSPFDGHDPNDDDDDDDDNGGSFHMYYPSPPPLHQDEGVCRSPIDVGQSTIHEEEQGDHQPPQQSPHQEEEHGEQDLPHRSPQQEEEQGDHQPPQQSPQQEEEQGDQQPPYRSPQQEEEQGDQQPPYRSPQQEEEQGDQEPPHWSPQQEKEQGDHQLPHRSPQQKEEQGDQQPPYQSPQWEEEQGDHSHTDLEGVSVADIEREHDQDESMHEQGKQKTKPAVPLWTLYTDPGPAKKKKKVVQQQGEEVAESIDPVEVVYNEYKTATTLDLRRSIDRCGWSVIPTTLVTLENVDKWLTNEHIDSYLMCLRKKGWNEMEDRRYAVHGSSLFALMTAHYRLHYVSKQKTFDPVTANVPLEWLAYGHGHIDASVPWWRVDSVLLPCSLNQEHWVLCEVRLREQRIIIYDPLASVDIAYRRQPLEPLVCLMPILLRFLGFYEETQVDMPPVDVRWKVQRLGQSVVPQQPDGTSCGAYVAMYVRDLVQRRTSTWKSRKCETIADVIALRAEIARDIYMYSKPIYKVNNFGKWFVDTDGEIVYN